MDLTNLSVILAEAAAPQPDVNPQAVMMKQLLLFIAIPVFFYFVLMRPQQKRAKEQAEMLKSVKAGDKIVTTGGVIGVVITVKEKSITLRSADTKLEITRSGIAEITERSGESSES
jgi:preprotein translocase subunit YajC